MPPSPYSFTALNLPPDFSLPHEMDYFTMPAPPNTQIWRLPLSRDIQTAPILCTCLRTPFIIAEVTITADWELEGDQAGLVIFTGLPPGEVSARNNGVDRRRPRFVRTEEDPVRAKWVKAGLEFTSGTLNASSVAATSANGADWCLCPISPYSCLQDPFSAPTPSLRIKLERIGESLWIWYQPPGINSPMPTHRDVMNPVESVAAHWRKMREVTGFFSAVEEKEEIWIGCYAARPMRWEPSSSCEGHGHDNSRRGLHVEFEDLEII